MCLSDELLVVLGEDSLAISGELTRRSSARLLQWIEALPAIAHLELADLDIEDGVAATEAVNVIRLMRSRVPLLRITAAPQVLAHNLYRTGLLMQGGIELIAMREDEAYG